MIIDILHRSTGAVIYHSETATTIAEAVIVAKANLSWADLFGANLSGANLSWANLSWANLSRANLSWANLSRANLSGADLFRANLSRANLFEANLSGANLSWANLSRANLSGANLSRANLSRAVGLNKFLTTPLYALRDQPGKIRAYKLVTAENVGPFEGGITYRVGESCELTDADTDESIQCAAGINLATLDWCMRGWRPGYRILIAEFKASDIAAIPIGSDGKFRVFRCRIVGEKDLAEIGLVAAEITGEKGGKP